MAEFQFSTLWWEPCIWCNTCGGRYGVREYQRCCIIPAAGQTPQLSLILCLITFPQLHHLSLFFLSFYPLHSLLPYIAWWPPVHVCVHMWSWKQVTGNLGRLCFCVEVSMSQQDWILPWSLTLRRAPCFPSALCLDKGPPFHGPPSTYSWDAGWSDYLDGETCTCAALPSDHPPGFMLANPPAQQCESPVLASHRNLWALLLLFRCNKQVVVCLVQVLLQHKALMKPFVNLPKSGGITWASYKCKEKRSQWVESSTTLQGA